MTAYQRDEGSTAFSGYPPSHAHGLNDAPANRASRGENHTHASFAPNAVHATSTSLSDPTTVPPPPPPQPLGGLPPHAHTSHSHAHGQTFYQGGNQQQHIRYPPHVGFVSNGYSHDQSTYSGVLGATQAAVMQVRQPQRHRNAAAAAAHPWGTNAGLHGLTPSVSIPPSGGMNFASQAHLQAPIGHAHNSSAHSSSFFVLPDENTRPPAFTSSTSQNDPFHAKMSSTDASLSHPLAQHSHIQVQHELGPYTHPLPLNPKQVASQNVHSDSSKNGFGVINMPPNCVTDENSASNGNFAQPPAQTLSNSVLTESRGKMSSTDGGFRQTSMHAPQTNSNARQLDQNLNLSVRPPLCEQNLNPKCGNRQQEKSVKEEEASPPVTKTGEGEGEAVALMTDEVEVGAGDEMLLKPGSSRGGGGCGGGVTTHRSPRARKKGGRTLSAEEQANDCDLFFDSDEILVGMRQSEMEFAPLILKDYMSVQKSLNNRMRLIVIDWLYEVEQEYTLDDRTMFLAVNYLDRFLSQVHLRRDQLQLVGTTCLYLASKFQEIDPPTAAQYTFIADKTFSIDQLFQMESCVLDVLSFRLAATTSYDFLLMFIMKLELPEKVEKFALYLLSLFVESVNYGRFLPSQEAAAAIYLAKLYIFGDDSWTAKYERVCNFGLENLTEIVRLYDAMHRTQYEHFVKHFLFDRGAPGHAVSDKFAATLYGEVSKVIAPLNYGGPRVTQPCDPQKLRQGTIKCCCPRPKCQPLR